MADIKISQLGEALAVTDNDILPMTASGVTSKVKASTMKSYMVDDLDVSDLHDTTITTPTDDDGLVYNSTSQKWENKPIVTGDLWVKNGAHNLLYNRTSGSNILGGITITTNSDKSITVGAGTSTSTDNIMVSGSSPSWSSAEQSLTKGQYRVSMQGSDVPITLVIEIEDDGVHGNITAQVTGNQVVTFTINRDCRIYAYLLISSGATVPSGTLKPMITSIDDPSTEYAPYAKTNRELTDGLSDKADNYIHDASTDSYIFTMKTVNNIAQGYVGVSQMKFSPSLGKIFFYALDGTYMGETTYTPAT